MLSPSILIGKSWLVIKTGQPQTFANVDAKDIKLWKVTIPGDHDDQLKNLKLNGCDELSAIKKNSKYFPDSPAEEHIHVLVEPPVSTVTSSREQELLEQVASLQALLNNDDPNPSIDVYSVFSCGSADLTSEKSKAVIKHLMAELNLRKKTTPIDMAYEATKSIYSYCYLASGVSLYENNFKIIPEKLVMGHNGQDILDLAIECRSTGRIAGLVEVKKDDFKQGLAQATVQIYG
ncbi:hypothetical protein C1645_831933 [Glomus cerebriforme]|uniref:Crinkler effector protein N-terminal domain-containing protein n=1 Tax=Glomus cerebriforme TaxID=658196 RepID=A0A397SGH8_9GLOM|nr:hypothetical protein C1645_831933 [Glomus cerebriforme]